MKKKLSVALILSMLLYSSNAYAVFDIMAMIMSKLETYENAMAKIEEYQKRIHDAQVRARQGFEIAKSCYSNPRKCDYKALEQIGKEAEGWVKDSITDVRTMPNAKAMMSGNLNLKAEKGLADSIVKGYIYVKGQGNSLVETKKNEQFLNAIITDEAAILFAKSVATSQSIRNEDGALYQYKFKNNNIDEILKAHTIVSLATQYRINRILELKAYMIGGPATSELSKSTREYE